MVPVFSQGSEMFPTTLEECGVCNTKKCCVWPGVSWLIRKLGHQQDCGLGLRNPVTSIVFFILKERPSYWVLEHVQMLV